MPDTRFTAVFRFNADSLDDAKTFARGIRQADRNVNARAWDTRDARLLRVQEPKDEADRYEAIVKFNAGSLTEAQRFGRTIRRSAQGGVQGPRRSRGWGYGSRSTKQWKERDARLLRIVDPTVAAQPAVVAETGQPASTAAVVAEQAEA